LFQKNAFSGPVFCQFYQQSTNQYSVLIYFYKGIIAFMVTQGFEVRVQLIGDAEKVAYKL